MKQTFSHSDIPILILAGGFGTRISEETDHKPKPMVEIGEIPILLHIMRYYYSHGFNNFVICAGYKSWAIKDYFLNYKYRNNDIEINDFGSEILSKNKSENWTVTIVDTGTECMTGARIARTLDKLSEHQLFSHFGVTYGDGLADVNLTKELDYHIKHGKIGTMLAVKPNARFGEIESDKTGTVKSFLEKPESKQGLINGGFFFFKKEFVKYLSTDADCILEQTPLTSLVKDKQLKIYKHTGFWQCMDTLRDKMYLQKLWETKKAPWKR